MRLWQVLVPFRVDYYANFVNIWQQDRVTWKDMIDISNFPVWDPVAATCLILAFLNKLLIDSWRSISKSVNHFFDHGFECLFGSLISTDTIQNVLRSSASPLSYTI